MIFRPDLGAHVWVSLSLSTPAVILFGWVGAVSLIVFFWLWEFVVQKYLIPGTPDWLDATVGSYVTLCVFLAREVSIDSFVDYLNL